MYYGLRITARHAIAPESKIFGTESSTGSGFRISDEILVLLDTNDMILKLTWVQGFHPKDNTRNWENRQTVKDAS